MDHRDARIAADSHAVELRKEAFTMALYVAICLLAALTAVADHSTREVDTFKIVWGTTVGLALAHWLAFRVSARLVASGVIRRHDAQAAVAQLAGAVLVALLATIPVLLFGATSELDVVRVLLAVFIAAVGFTVARGSGATSTRSALYAGSVLVIAVTVAIVKNVLAGH